MFVRSAFCSASVLLEADGHVAFLACVFMTVQFLDAARNPAANTSEEAEEETGNPPTCTQHRAMSSLSRVATMMASDNTWFLRPSGWIRVFVL